MRVCMDCGWNNQVEAHQKSFVATGNNELRCETCDRNRRIRNNPENVLSSIKTEDLYAEIARRNKGRTGVL